MKQLLIKLAAVFGVVPVPRYNALVKQLDEARTSAHGWKGKAREAMARAKALEGDVKRHEHLVKEARIAAEKMHQSQTEATRLQEQLADTERELLLAREHLMAIEVKLDILEGAANVLDSRTRAALRRQATSTGAPV